MRRAENPSPRQASARRGVLHSMYGPDRAARASFEERRRNAPRKCTGVFALAETTSKTRHSHGSFLDLATDMGTTTWTTAGRTASRRNEARKCTGRLHPAKTTSKTRHSGGPCLDSAAEAGAPARTGGATMLPPDETKRESAPAACVPPKRHQNPATRTARASMRLSKRGRRQRRAARLRRFPPKRPEKMHRSASGSELGKKKALFRPSVDFQGGQKGTSFKTSLSIAGA